MTCSPPAPPGKEQAGAVYGAHKGPVKDRSARAARIACLGGDVPILASFFLEHAVRAYGKNVRGFAPDTMAALCGYHGPGNVRQLQNAVNCAVLLCAADVVRPADFSEIAAAADRPANFSELIRQEKRRRFMEALHRAGWNQSAAARLLGMSRSNFARMLRALDINVPARGGRRAAPLSHQSSPTKLA